jgi:hypothetical protein
VRPTPWTSGRATIAKKDVATLFKDLKNKANEDQAPEK